MASRFLLFVGAVLCGSLFGADAALAQKTVHLRASYRGEFLPGGTELIVLTKAAQHARDGRFQPEFIPKARYPLQRFDTMERDRVGSGRMSEKSYRATDVSKSVYFLYALTPDSTLFWSYSSQRDSLKFDVVSTGVMSVAPVTSREAAEDILSLFFRPRITVYMPEDARPEADPPNASADTPVMMIDSVAGVPPNEPRVDSLIAAALPVATVPPVARVRESGFRLPAALAFLLLLLVASAVSAPLYFARRFRREAEQLRHEVARRQNVEEDYEVLKARMAALERELAQLRR